MKELIEALAKAQAEMKNPTFDATNPHFKSKFATLAAVRNAIIPIAASHGIFVSQDLQTTDRGIACTTIVRLGDQSLCFGPLVMPATKSDAQGLGSAATYARRYSLMSAFGLVGDEDDDGNGASDKSKSEKKDPVQQIKDASVQPLSGVEDALSAGEVASIIKTAAQITDMYNAGMEDKAYAEYLSIKDSESDKAVDELNTLWKHLPSNVRSGIKKIGVERAGKALVGSQA